MEQAGWYHTEMTAKVIEPDDPDPAPVGVGTAPGPLPDQSDRISIGRSVQPEIGPAEAVDTKSVTAVDTESVVEELPQRQITTHKVGGWAQLGADSEQLEEDKLQCRETGAGEAAFNECMQGKGWRPLGVQLSSEEQLDD
jgi:hypothetical protein